jgi:hypothetical protein
MSSTRPGNQQRGWNDPPEFLHNNDTVNLVTNERTILNKRVSHITYDNTKPATVDSSILTPATLNMPPASAPQVALDENIQKSAISEVEEEIRIEEIEEIIKKKLEFLKESGVSTKIIDDILKRVKIFTTNWEKLSKTVKSKMHELAKGNLKVI